jgi:hypothetical protein
MQFALSCRDAPVGLVYRDRHGRGAGCGARAIRTERPSMSNTWAFDRCHDPASGVAASCQFNKGQFGKQRLARRWCRFC